MRIEKSAALSRTGSIRVTSRVALACDSVVRLRQLKLFKIIVYSHVFVYFFSTTVDFDRFLECLVS